MNGFILFSISMPLVWQCPLAKLFVGSHAM